jgi:hypothetical protein
MASSPLQAVSSNSILIDWKFQENLLNEMELVQRGLEA